ncbi:MAG TPA: DUF899 domain-containing protein [Gammaproteobacteria bacterium]|nr:DUF899 domain-containing protein [Gammaproteobacteria bacterium]HIL98621.1 DUF899 domain-containing protein [Pseudomonadales bacterium]
MAVVSRETWLQERMALLRREKTITRELDLLAKERQKLPWVKIEKICAANPGRRNFF